MRTLTGTLLLALSIPAFAATITVTGTGDAIAADGQCTLREAITAANTNSTVNECTAGAAGLDTIAFNIGVGAQTIAVTGSLPFVTEAANIDGSTQPGFATNPLVTLSGTLPNSAIVIGAAAGGSTVRSLAIGGFQSAVIVESANNLVAGNHIGINDAGTAATPNNTGIELLSPASNTNTSNNTVQGNLVSGNTTRGILIAANHINGGKADNNLVQDNIVGLNEASTAPVPNGIGIELQNVTGTRILNNTVAGNTGNGINLANAAATTIQGNAIGLTGFGNFGDGIAIDVLSNSNIIGATASGGSGGNTIQDNSGAGARVDGTGNRILTNSMATNSSLGIDLYPIGPSPNDACDTDSGANTLQNFPTLTSATSDGTRSLIAGTLNSTASSSFTLEFFQDSFPGGQGGTYLGSATVTTDGSCVSNFSVAIPAAVSIGQYVTATATNSGNNTSELSAAVAVASALAVTKSFTPTSIIRNMETSTAHIVIQNPGDSTETNVGFTDTLPANVVIAAGGGSTTCGGTLTATPGNGSFTLSGASLPSGGSCTVDVDVTSGVAGTYRNTLAIGTIAGDASQNIAPASAQLQVTELAAPGVAKTFTPSSILPAGTTQLQITLTNASGTAITGVQFIDSYPAGLVNASTATTTCGGTATATPGGLTLTLSGGTIPASGNCTVTVTVQAPAGGSFTNTLPAGAVTSANAAPSASSASAALIAGATIPTTSGWGLLLILMSIGAAAVLRLRG